MSTEPDDGNLDSNSEESSDDELQPAQFLYTKKSEHAVLTPKRGCAPDDVELTPPAAHVDRRKRQDFGKRKGKYAQKFKIATLLSSKYDADGNEKNINEMEDKLQGNLNNGGILSLIQAKLEEETIESECEDNSQKSETELRHDFPVTSPGRLFFDDCEKITEPQSLRLPGFVASFCRLEPVDANASAEEQTKTSELVVRQILSEQWLSHWEQNGTVPDDVYEWCFELMCFDKDGVIPQLCYEFLVASNNWRKQTGAKPKLIVDTKKFAMVLRKCNAKQERLDECMSSVECLLPADQVELTNMKASQNIQSLHFKQLLGLLGCCVTQHVQCYSLASRRFILILCFHLLMDHELSRWHSVLRQTVGCVLDSYSESDFNVEVLAIKDVLSHLASHHHDMVHLVDMIPVTERGFMLRNFTATTMLKKLSTAQIIIGDSWRAMHEETIDNAISVLRGMNLSDSDCDYYESNSILCLLGASVDSSVDGQRGRQDAMARLVSTLKCLHLQIKDASGTFINRTKVKATILNIIMRLSLSSTVGDAALSAFEDNSLVQRRLCFGSAKVEPVTNSVDSGWDGHKSQNGSCEQNGAGGNEMEEVDSAENGIRMDSGVGDNCSV